MGEGICHLTPPSTFTPAFQKAYRETIRSIEASLRRGEVPDFDGEIARLQTTVLSGGADVGGRMSALTDYRSIVTGQCRAPEDHPVVRFVATAGEGTTTNITITVTEKGRSRPHTITGAIDASRLSEADSDRFAADSNYCTRRMLVNDGGTLTEKTYFIPVERHPVTRVNRPLLATTR
jgi:hypothetical protein